MKFPIKTKNNLFLAPLAGITDYYFRSQCLKFGAGMVTIPMVNANAVVRKNKATLDLLKTSDAENPKSVQLFGTKTNVISKAVKIIDELTNPECIDFNMGCPERAIIRQGAGAALLKRPGKIKDIVETVRSSTDKPISIKIRIGGSKKSINVIKNSEIIQSAGASFLTVHGRTVEQGYSGKADWDIIKQVKENISIPLVANGDVIDGKSAKLLFEKTNCDAIMIGRAALGRPFIFERISNFLNNIKGKEYDQIALLKTYLNEASDIPFAKQKQHALYYTKGLKDSTSLRLKISKTTNINEILSLIDK